ncbi:MAG: family 10 glycosylhydrolase [Armatimonadota bacterium]|nr:family 10 glycosylhydrolase [bacterium]
MTRNTRTFLILCCLLTLAGRAAFTSSKAEFRGGWVTAWNKGFLTPQEADATISAAKRAGINALFIQARKVGDAYYESATEPRGDNLAPGYDPLAYLVEKAHAQGIQVHAWVNVCRIWRSKTPPADPNHVVNLHPDWLVKDINGTTWASDGVFLDPGVPAAREYVASVIEEIACRYAVDGIHLDYIRYPGKNWGYSETALNRFYADTGASSKPDPESTQWMRWRRDQVTDMLRLIRGKVLAVRPHAVISAATIAWGGCPSDFNASYACKLANQDWRTWMAQGLLDANIPMDYKSETSSTAAAQFRGWLGGFKKWGAGKPTYVGVDIHSNSTKSIMKQISAIRKARLGGFVLFSFNDTPLRDAIVDALAGK